MLITLLRVAGWLERIPELENEGEDSVIKRLLESMDITAPLQKIARQSGYQLDYLSRLVKKQTGLSLGQLRTHRRLEKAKELLSQRVRVANVADAIGILDPSYFSRWFHQQTGQVPSYWFEHDRKANVPALS
jgi:AraC family L-rhamnose operon transcriptional activator RhaR